MVIATGDSLKVARSREKYASGLVGVVKEKSGLILTDSLSTEDSSEKVAVAVAGRVKVNASNETGAIKAGDYLAAGSIPGHVMLACGETECQPGMVIGMSLEDFSEVSGQISVLISKFNYLPEEFIQNVRCLYQYHQDCLLCCRNLSLPDCRY